MAMQSSEGGEKLAVIDGKVFNSSTFYKGKSVHLDGELQIRFGAFLNQHKGKVIDWNVTQQSLTGNWYIFVRYTE